MSSREEIYQNRLKLAKEAKERAEIGFKRYKNRVKAANDNLKAIKKSYNTNSEVKEEVKDE